METPQTIVDVQGLKCPMPMLRTKKALAKLESGQVIQVLATDPHAVPDLQQFCKQTGHKMLDTQKTEDIFVIQIQKK
ncbi:MAG: sulfurtransferase TusA family protein [Burkholderiaceae bacterium]|nr:sulfurtransferase TusA family protein [Burkholderiaceae bacterium]